MFIKPCHGLITSLYDMNRKHPITGKTQPHWGVDYGSADNNTIYAAAHGVVRFIGRGHKTAGNYVVITHPNGWETAYLHLASVSVNVGQSVVAGKAIGVKGMTGGSTGVHLHFEMTRGKWTGGSSLHVNPVLYIDDPDVRNLQLNLNKLGYSLTVDGKYGDSTIKAVSDYQKKNSLTADGVSGRLTIAAIEKSRSELEKEVVKVAAEVNQKPSPTLAKEFARAIEAGITDGSNPQNIAKREEVAVMVLRAFEKLQGKQGNDTLN